MNIKCMLLVTGLLCAGIVVQATEESAPIARIELGMHTMSIRQISTDQSGKIALTVSEDKTGRIWDTSTSKLLKVLRGRAGVGHEGEFYCGELTADGKTAILGGYLKDAKGIPAVLLFDCRTGETKGQISNIFNAAVALALSPDQRMLAVGSAGGIQLFSFPGGRPLGSDQEYGNVCWSIHFSADGKTLASSSRDGYVRIYSVGAGTGSDEGSSLQFTRKFSLDGKEIPFDVRFSPGGEFLAVGREVVKNVAYFTTSDWKIHYTTDFPVETNGGFENLAWSTDGSILYAGGNVGMNGNTFIRRFRIKNNDELSNLLVRQPGGMDITGPLSIRTTQQTVMSLCAMPNGYLLYATDDPAWGEYNNNGLFLGMQIAPVIDNAIQSTAVWGSSPQQSGNGLRISDDGNEVSFSYSFLEDNLVKFSVSEQKLIEIESYKDMMQRVDDDINATNAAFAANHVHSPLMSDLPRGALKLPPEKKDGLRGPIISGLRLGNWKNSTAPLIGHKRLQIGDDEISLSLAIAVDRSFFALGTSKSLRKYRPNGEPLWSIVTQDQVRAVNITKDGRVIVAAIGDGSIRWYLATNGKELAAFYPSTDRERWVFWCPEGYYSCTPNAEFLLGWQVNHGADIAADFFPFSSFHKLFYRPDVLNTILKTKNIQTSLQWANKSLHKPETKADDISEIIDRIAPPTVKITSGDERGEISIPAEAKHIQIGYLVRLSGTEAAELMVRFNGRLVMPPTALLSATTNGEVDIPIPQGMSGDISLIAKTDLASSRPDILHVTRPSGGGSVRKPNLYLLTVGLSRLKLNTTGTSERGSGFADLPGATKPAGEIELLFKAQEKRLYDRVYSVPLKDQTATVPGIKEALKWIAQEAGPEDVAVVAFFGHGEIDQKLGFYLATYETDRNAPSSTALSGKELSAMLEDIKGRTVLVLDTCRAGGAFGETQKDEIVTCPDDLTGMVDRIASADEGTIVFASSQDIEESFEDPGSGGLFGKAFYDGLVNGNAAKGMTCIGMKNWLQTDVPQLVNNLAASTKHPTSLHQTPVCMIPEGVPDFFICKP